MLPSASKMVPWYLKNGVNLPFYRKKKITSSFIRESKDIKPDISQNQGEAAGKKKKPHPGTPNCS